MLVLRYFTGITSFNPTTTYEEVPIIHFTDEKNRGLEMLGNWASILKRTCGRPRTRT